MMMKCNPDIHYRRSIRLKGYDYSSAGAYFVKACTKSKECLFDDVVKGKMQLNEYGGIIEKEWIKTEDLRANVMLDEYVVMPNHIHCVIGIIDPVSS